MTAEEYIENECFVVVNPDYPVISKENTLKAVEISVYEERQKAIVAHWKCCPNLSKDNDRMCNHQTDCNQKCQYMNDFINQI